MLTTADKKYINDSISKSNESLRKDFDGLRTDILKFRDDIKSDFDHTLGLYLDQIKYEHKLTRELLDTKPSREEVKSMIHEELVPVRQEISLLRTDLQEHIEACSA